jgi:hypothetical protein
MDDSKQGRPQSDELTKRKIDTFIDEILKYKNGVEFRRKIGSVVVRATFHVYRGRIFHNPPIYLLKYADDNNAAKIVIDSRVYRSSSLHHVIQDFKRSIEDYLCVLS